MSDRPTVVLGAAGFVGAALVRHLRYDEREVVALSRGDPMPKKAGDVFQCAGLTADFRTRPHDTITAHVTLVNEVLQRCDFDSLTYLSSTRIYQKVASGHEDASLLVDPGDPSDLYNLSKLTGEAACLTDPRGAVRVVRLSNVFGPGDGSGNFLDTVIQEAKRERRVVIRSGALAAKDYVALSDVVEALARIPERARSRLINIASGVTTSNAAIGALIEHALAATVEFGPDVAGTRFPDIDVARMRSELGIEPRSFNEAFLEMLDRDRHDHPTP